MTAPADDLRALLDGSAVMSLGVLDEGAPAVSLVGYVALWEPARLYTLVSELSPHTRALRIDGRCGWMVNEPPRTEDARSNHALARIMGRAIARFVTRDDARSTGVEARYREKYPIAETLLGLTDFHVVELAVQAGSVSFVQGFGRAYAVTGDELDVCTHVKGR